MPPKQNETAKKMQLCFIKLIKLRGAKTMKVIKHPIAIFIRFSGNGINEKNEMRLYVAPIKPESATLSGCVFLFMIFALNNKRAQSIKKLVRNKTSI